MAFDRQRTRLLVLEAQGRMQVFDARLDRVGNRYLTQWGRLGTGDGEFFVSPPTNAAMVVDAQGRIYVADGAGRMQVFTP
jgi:hypothetical protein